MIEQIDRNRFWVIYRKSDNAIMPMPAKSARGLIGGFSYIEFDVLGPRTPRLFSSEGSARRALTAWCMGKWGGDQETLPYVLPNTSRPRSEYGIALAEIILL